MNSYSIQDVSTPAYALDLKVFTVGDIDNIIIC